ncbi:A-kinase anchor protein 9 isoform X2 [Pseudorasbora parva]|uniref:A-kinase anchor protein 9 isoform X2 n=1 Tax=Pseudorasbora parva TaxID=51549 RepID=UPI00351F7492
MMEDEERQRKLQAGKAKLAEYRQRKAQSDGQKKKKKKKKPEADVEEQSGMEGEEPGNQRAMFSLSKTLRSGETVTHDQTYTIEPESEVSTTAEDCSSEVNGFQEQTSSRGIAEEDLPQTEVQMEPAPESRILEEESVAELSRELEQMRAADGVQQLQEFEEALKQRDEIITQLTANMQQARAEKEEVMREFLQLTEQSQKLQIQFQQLQAGEVLRSSSISSTAADLLQARQQITLYQQQLDEKDTQVKGYQEKTQEQRSMIAQLQERLSEAQRVRPQAEESSSESLQEKDVLNSVQQQRLISEHLQLITQLQDQLLTSKQQAEEVNRRLTAKTQELDNCERELSMSKQQTEEANKHLTIKTQELDDCERKLSSSKQQADETNKLLIAKTQELDNCERELSSSKQQAEETNKLLTIKTQELDNCKQELSASKQQAEETNKHLIAKTQELENFKQDLSASKQQAEETNKLLIAKTQELDNCERELSASKQQAEETNKLLIAKTQELENFKQDLSASKQQAEETNKHLIAKTQELENFKQDLSASKQQAEETNKHLIAKTQELDNCEQDLSASKQQAEETNKLLIAKSQELDNCERKLSAFKQKAEETNKLLTAKTQELDECERELSASKQKERMSSGEILQLMKTVENLQQRCHHGSQSEGETLQRMEDEWSRRMEQLRAELDEMYGQQIVQMKQELRLQHAAEMDRIREQSRSEAEKIVQEHQSELERFKGQLFQSTGGANVLNVRVIELQQKLQETQVLREKAEQEGRQAKAEQVVLAQQAERLRDELRSARSEVAEIKHLRDGVHDMQARLKAAQEANVELQAAHESEITNYKIKLDMLEREKDAVLDRMAESQEAELDRLRTQLLFSHEEELSRLRDDLQREGQLNVQNLRDEMGVRYREATENYEDQLRSVKEELEHLRRTQSPSLMGSGVEELKEDFLQEINRLTSENQEAMARIKDLQDELENQRNTFSFAEKNFEVNFQELKDEYACLASAKTQLEERLSRESRVYSTHEEVDGKTQPEKHTSELMEKLEAAEIEKKSLAERLALMQADAKRLEDELEMRRKDKDHHMHIRSVQEEAEEQQEGRESESTTASRLGSHTHTHTPAAAAQEDPLSLSFSLAQQDETGDAQADGDHVRVSCLTQPLEMDGAEHEECRLQLEAQRISLSQIHAAQLELLQETLSGEPGVKGQPADPSEPSLQQLKSEFADCSLQMEERHRQEMERLKSHYQQQMEEKKERFMAEILLLQQRLTELTGAEELCSMPSISPPLTRDVRGEHVQDEQRVCVDGAAGLWREQLQAGQEASCVSSREGELMEPQTASLQHILEEQIAKVIVQMSVEFAQQTELARMSRQARETEEEEEEEKKKEEEEEEEGKKKEEEEEVIKVKGHGGSVTSQSPAQDPELASDDIITERDLLRQANVRLRQVLIDVLKTTAAAEETIGRHVEVILEASSRGHTRDASSEDLSLFSAEIDEGLEMSLKIPGAGLLQQEAGLLYQEAELQLEREEFLMSISTRLQNAVEKLLMAITETNTQLEHARITQTELLREKFRHNEEMEELQRRQEELQERLCEEARAREQLALELHRAEGVIDGHTGERLALEQQVRERAELSLHLQQELSSTSIRLSELEEERRLVQHERMLLSRQQDALREGAGSPELRLVEAALDAAPEADLLEETEKLMVEKMEVQRQAQKESGELQMRVKQLEAELEEQVSRVLDLQDSRQAQEDDLRQQIQALEKQLEHNRRFMDEQAMDREHERDVFQLEIHNLEQQLKNPPKTGTGSERRDREVQELIRALQEKSDCCSELLLSSEQLQRDVCERDEEIETLSARVRELEQTLMHRVEEVQHVSMAGRGDVTLEAQLQTEREALDRKEKEIVNLEEQLEQFREELENKSEEVNQLHMQLEIQRKEISSHQQDLQAQARLTQVLQEREGQIALLNEQIVKRQRADTHPEEQALEQKQEDLREMEMEMEILRSEQERLRRSNEEEVEQLNAVIEKLQQELQHIERKMEDEMEEEMEEKMEDELHEMTQKMEEDPRDELHEVTQKMKEGPRDELHEIELKMELDTLKAEYERMEEELRDRTAAFVVVQAQVQALEESAGSKVASLSLRVEELEECVEEKDSELRSCRLRVEQAQADANALYTKVGQLEDKLREKVAAVLVCQAQLGAVQKQTKELRAEALAEDPMGSSVQLQQVGFTAQDPTGLSAQLQMGGLVAQDPMGHSAQPQQVGLTAQDPTGPSAQLQQVGLRAQDPTGPSAQLQAGGLEAQEPMGPSAQLQAGGLVAQEPMGPSTQLRARIGAHTLTEKLRELEEGLSGMQKDQELQKQLLSSSEDEVMEYERRLALMMNILNQMRTKPAQLRSSLTADLHHTESGEGGQSELLQELQEVKGQAASTKEELNCYRELSHKLQEEIEMKESTITQLQTALSQISARSRDEDSAETARLLQELQEVKGQAAGTRQELEVCRGQLQEREMSLALLKDQLHRASQDGDQSTAELLQELAEVKGQATATKEELSSFRERSLKLQEEIEVRDVSIAELRVKVQELQTAVSKSSEDPPQQQTSEPKKKAGKNGDSREHHGKGKSDTLPHRTSADQSCADVCTQTDQSRADVCTQTDQSRADVCTETDQSGAEDVEEMMAGFAEKIGQMQELHAAEIMDMEARHISESESLRRENRLLEQESRALRDAIEKLRASEGPSVRSDRPAVSAFKDGYASDSSSDWSQRTGYDPHLQQEFRSTPEGARRDPEPDVLPDRIKSLLREVHQEGMQVLSLSEADAELPPQAWSRERDALIHTIESLKLLISKLQTDTQVEGDWRAELLSAVQQVFVGERDVLKSVLYSHLEQLDTADAVIHLNQLELALAEQDAQHREVMDALITADRSSLRSEIHQLRAQLHTLSSTHTPHVDSTGMEGVREAEAVDRREEVKTELSQTKLQLESALKSQHKLLKELDTLRAEVCVKASEVDSLTDRLAQEQKRARELQWANEKQKCQSDQKQEAEREEVEDLKLALEEERQISARLREISVSSELQVQLDAQRARAVELSDALEKEKELNTQLLQRFHTSSASNPQHSGTSHALMQAEATCSQVEAGVLSVESLLQTLQTQLAEKQEQVVQMMEELERHKLDAVKCKRQWEEEKNSLTRSSTQELSTLRAKLEGLERQVEELRAELEAERESVRRMERERERLQERVRELEDRSVRTDGQPADRTRDWVLQQKTGDTLSSDPKHMDSILSRLQLIAARINGLTSDTPGRSSAEGPDRESLAWLHSNVQDVMSLLQHVPSAPSALPESAALLAGGSSSLLNERLLRQNAELTGFVSRLTEEKNDLRNQLLNLEEELRRYRQKKLTAESVSSRQELVLFSSERESWARERSRLEKSVRQAESELSRLRAEVRSDTLRDLTGADLDSTALKRMYGRYLRAESFRKALVYQKKYLLLLLGGFQECEEATLSLIARMGGHPSHTPELSRTRRGLTRFRSAVRVSIALSRMRFLVKRWQRAGGAVTSPIVSRNGLSQITGADVRNESSFLHPGSVEVFRERQASSRGRTGRDSPRSGASAQHRYHSMAADHGGLSCSHLQNYDPDRALTDYISRLEALQRRLGSVQSGSSSYAQLHFGVRR